MPGFVFATCREGSEAALKHEVAALHGGRLRPAFMRPQLITWKSDDEIPADFDLQSVFARVSGVSLGGAESDGQIVDKAKQFARGSALHLHVFPRETPEDGLSVDEWSRIDARRTAIATALKDAGLILAPVEDTPADGDIVLDVVVESDSERSLVGTHRHRAGKHPLPGALARLQLPSESPSRAWLKLEQALIWAGWEVKSKLSGKTALELGCSPGGATYALLQHGVRVIGVDPEGPMSERVLALAEAQGGTFTHLPIPAGALAAQSMHLQPDLLISDMNLAPPVVLKYLERIQKRVQARAFIVTLKLNDRPMQEQVHDFIASLRSFAPAPVHAMQLPANRSEICVIAGSL